MTSQPLALSLNRHPRKVFHCRDLLLSWIFHRIFTSFPIKFSVDSWSQWSNFFYMCYFLFYWEKKKNIWSSSSSWNKSIIFRAVETFFFSLSESGDSKKTKQANKTEQITLEKCIYLSVLHLGCDLAPGTQGTAVTTHLSSGA